MNYRDELYKNIIIKARKELGYTPLKDEAKKRGINIKYVKKKYGSYGNFVNSLGFKRRQVSTYVNMEINPEHVRLVLFDRTKKEVVMVALTSKISEYIDCKKINIRARFVDRDVVKSKYYVFHLFNFEIFKLCDYDFNMYKRVMLYKYNKKYLRKNRENYKVIMETKEKLDKGEVSLEDLIDADKFKNISQEDYQ